MNAYQPLLDRLTEESKRILGENLTGIYLHGSAAMGCFNQEKSDIDLLVVVKNSINHDAKRAYMDMIVALNQQAPEKGIEISIILESVCKPFVYPTPFELHFSNAHLNWYHMDPNDYVQKMQGTDRDLAAHIMILWHRGKVIYGRNIDEVFSEPDKEAYFDSIYEDVKDAKCEVLENPVYVILNLCRVLAYHKESLILSKLEGGKWGIEHMPNSQYRELIAQALDEYQTGRKMAFDADVAVQFVEYALKQIR